MRIVMAGSSGYLGRHLSARLTGEGHQVDRLVRRSPAGEREIAWSPYHKALEPSVLHGADAVINLCGVGVADRRWSPTYKKLIRHTRVTPTRVLSEAAAAAGVPVQLNASAVGWYSGGDSTVDESAPAADGFLGETCAAWEDATAPARQAGVRVVRLRTGHVLAADSEMIKRLLPVFKLGIGGRFGSGRQYFPWISLTDWLAATDFVLNGGIDGPVNLVAPNPVTNAEFTGALGKVMHRPAMLAVPGFALKIAVGEAAVELLNGARIVPKVLTDNGYEFTHPTVTEALAAALNG